MRHPGGTFWLAALFLAGLAGRSWAQVDEAQLKAAFVVNFAAYVIWSDEDFQRQAPLTLCVRSGGEIEHALLEIDGRRVAGQSIRVRVLHSVDELTGCQIVVVDFPQRARPETIVPGVASLTLEPSWPDCWWCRTGVLSVGNGGDLNDNQTVLTLFRDGNRIRFDVDTVAARSAKVELSSRLLRLARSVR